MPLRMTYLLFSHTLRRKEAGNQLEIVQDLVLNEFSKAKIESYVDELKEERAMVSHLIAS